MATSPLLVDFIKGQAQREEDSERYRETEKSRMATSLSLADLSKGHIQCRMATSPPLVDLNEDQIQWNIERERGIYRERERQERAGWPLPHH